MIKHLLFDLDNTLYSNNTGMEQGFQRRIIGFAARFLGITPEEAVARRREGLKNYGATIEWLMGEYGFSAIDDYYAAVHPAGEEDSIPPDPELRDFLEGLSDPAGYPHQFTPRTLRPRPRQNRHCRSFYPRLRYALERQSGKAPVRRLQPRPGRPRHNAGNNSVHRRHATVRAGLPGPGRQGAPPRRAGSAQRLRVSQNTGTAGAYAVFVRNYRLAIQRSGFHLNLHVRLNLS